MQESSGNDCPLQEVLARTIAARERGETPVVVFDLDHTLFDNGPRTLKILREFAQTTGRDALDKKLETYPPFGLPFLVSDLLIAMGRTDANEHKEAWDFWRDRFFYDALIPLDVAMEGTVEYVREIFDAGATVVYLTGRDSPNMLLGTTQSLQESGFPIGCAHTVLILKPDYDMDDTEFKSDVTAFVGTLGTVVGAFDNEPGNCNLFARGFDTCLSVLVGRTTAPNPPAPDANVVFVTGFERPSTTA